MQDPVDEILSKYGMNREKTKRYLDAVVRKNQTGTAEESEISRTTVQEYQAKFDEMSELERSCVRHHLSGETYYELKRQLQQQ